MITRSIIRFCVFATLLALGTGVGLDRISGQSPPNAEDNMQVLTRGPVHEAFAELVTFDPKPGIVVERAPPQAIEELPPEQRPTGANVAWIPGYWGWDEERNDFLWISGIWRALPPGRQWVPGYWAQSTGGFQWTSGYWADASDIETEYLPQPPLTVEAGPSAPATSSSAAWLPGCWIWHEGRYVWRPGFWASLQPDWDWIPSHYVCTPLGYVFVDGYWDYSTERRGMLFAPVYFSTNLYESRGFTYSPTMVVDLSVFTNYLFLRPNYSHYYFGDYYDTTYSTAGYYPSHSVFSSRQGYDPFYTHDRWENRDDSDWENRVHANFQRRREHEEARPPRTMADQRQRLSRGTASKENGDLVMARLLSEITQRTDNSQRFQALHEEERRQFSQSGQEIQKFRMERQRMEATQRRTANANPPTSVQRPKLKLPKSPILFRSGGGKDKDRTPPKPPTIPKIDTKAKKRGG